MYIHCFVMIACVSKCWQHVAMCIKVGQLIPAGYNSEQISSLLDDTDLLAVEIITACHDD